MVRRRVRLSWRAVAEERAELPPEGLNPPTQRAHPLGQHKHYEPKEIRDIEPRPIISDSNTTSPLAWTKDYRQMSDCSVFVRCQHQNPAMVPGSSAHGTSRMVGIHVQECSAVSRNHRKCRESDESHLTVASAGGSATSTGTAERRRRPVGFNYMRAEEHRGGKPPARTECQESAEVSEIRRKASRTASRGSRSATPSGTAEYPRWPVGFSYVQAEEHRGDKPPARTECQEFSMSVGNPTKGFSDGIARQPQCDSVRHC
jgi:hypothetical protein